MADIDLSYDVIIGVVERANYLLDHAIQYTPSKANP